MDSSYEAWIDIVQEMERCSVEQQARVITDHERKAFAVNVELRMRHYDSSAHGIGGYCVVVFMDGKPVDVLRARYAWGGLVDEIRYVECRSARNVVWPAELRAAADDLLKKATVLDAERQLEQAAKRLHAARFGAKQGTCTCARGRLDPKVHEPGCPER